MKMLHAGVGLYVSVCCSCDSVPLSIIRGTRNVYVTYSMFMYFDVLLFVATS